MVTLGDVQPIGLATLSAILMLMKEFSRHDQRLMATWSLDCAERVLHLFESVRPDDLRPRGAISVGRDWVRTGQYSMPVIRRASLDAHAAAKEVRDMAAACAAAHAAGQAVATAHVPQHAYGGAYYALKAIAAAADKAEAMHDVLGERDWQERHLPAPLRHEIMSRIVVEERREGPFVSVVKGDGF